MTRCSLSLAFLLAMLLSMKASAVQAPDIALCEAIAGQIRGSRQVSSGQDDPLSLLSRGNRPSIEFASQSEMKFAGGDERDKVEFVNAFLTKFNPSDELRKAFSDFLESGNIETLSLTGSDVHVATNVGGRALCARFMFFRTIKDRQSQLLPNLPLKGDRDGDNLICSNAGSDGYLARVGGVEAFLETYTGDTRYSFRVVPLKDDRWANACTVEVNFRSKYSASRAFVPDKGPITEADLMALAPQLVEKRDAARDIKSLTFGPPLSERDKSDVDKMIDLASRLGGRPPVPAFGKESDLGPGEESLVSGDSFPLVVNGRAYLLRLGEGQLGCCYFPGPILILYTLKDGKLEPVGSAFVEKSRGALESVNAKSSR